MTYVVTEPCIKCKYTDCAKACPIEDCFREGPNMLVINPETCIDCNACVAECPVDAIKFGNPEVDDLAFWMAENKRLADLWGPDKAIQRQIPAPPDADEWAKVKDKKHLLQE